MTNSSERSNLRGSSGPNIALLPALIGIAIFVLIVASLYWAQAVLIPVALAILLTFLLSPVAAALERIGLGRLPSVIACRSSDIFPPRRNRLDRHSSIWQPG